MKKLDILTPIGLISAIILVIMGILTGGQLKNFADLGSVEITIGGSFAAMLISYPMAEIKKLIKLLANTFSQQIMSNVDIIKMFTNLSRKARKEGLLSLEDDVASVDDVFLKKGMQMVVDGIEPETIKEIMELEIDQLEERHNVGINMLKTWGGFAPAYGMLGTLIGLINMLANLDDSSKIASGMAIALITTFYGSFLANIIFLPMASKLQYKTEKEVAVKEMMLEGILAIQSGVNPRIVEEKLISYLSPNERINLNQKNSDEGVTENV